MAISPRCPKFFILQLSDKALYDHSFLFQAVNPFGPKSESYYGYSHIFLQESLLFLFEGICHDINGIVQCISQVICLDGKLYISPIMDCYNGEILAVQMRSNMRAELCIDTLKAAAGRYPFTGETSVKDEIDEYIRFFNEERPAYSLNYLTPKQFKEYYSSV